MAQPTSPMKTTTLVALVFIALAAVAPFSVRGIAGGHDLAFHMNGWMEVAHQWKEGIVYPQWAAYANYGSGEPSFVFYPPLSWIMVAALGSFIPWMFTPVVFDCCAIVLAGLAMYRMARQWFDQRDATLAAVAYAVNPYMLLTIYVRSAFGELLAAAFLPLLVLWTARAGPARQMLLPLSFTVAAAWLTNIPAAIIATYVAGLLLVINTIRRGNLRVFVYGAAAITLGLALASFYIVPAIYEWGWISRASVLSAGARPVGNFLFALTGNQPHDKFLRALSWIAVAEMALTAVAILATFRRRKRDVDPDLEPGFGTGLALKRKANRSTGYQQGLWWSLIVPAIAALVLMLPIAGVAYRFLPDLRWLQFPWRWLLVVGLAYAIFGVTAVPRFRGKALLYTVLFLALIGGCNAALQAECDPADTSFMISNQFHTFYGYLGTDEYVPAGGDNYQIRPDFPAFLFYADANHSVPASGRVTHFHSSTYRKQLTVESPAPVEIVLRLMNYPAWQLKINGARVAAGSDPLTGRMTIALPAGHSQVDVRFVTTPDRWFGRSLSLAAMTFLTGFWYVERKRKQSQRVAAVSEIACP